MNQKNPIASKYRCQNEQKIQLHQNTGINMNKFSIYPMIFHSLPVRRGHIGPGVPR